MDIKQALDKLNDADPFTGITIDSVDVENCLGDTPLHVAAIWNDEELIRVLVANGAKLNKQGEHGYTPLHEAVEQNNVAAIKTLLELGAVEIKNNDGLTPTDLASSLGYKQIMKILNKERI